MCYWTLLYRSTSENVTLQSRTCALNNVTIRHKKNQVAFTTFSLCLCWCCLCAAWSNHTWKHWPRTSQAVAPTGHHIKPCRSLVKLLFPCSTDQRYNHSTKEKSTIPNIIVYLLKRNNFLQLINCKDTFYDCLYIGDEACDQIFDRYCKGLSDLPAFPNYNWTSLLKVCRNKEIHLSLECYNQQLLQP